MSDRVIKIRPTDPRRREVSRIREFNAHIERLAAQLREARKHDPDYKLDENYVRAVLNPEEFGKEKVMEPRHQSSAKEGSNGHA